MAGRHRADLPPIDPDRLKQEMMDRLDSPRILRAIRELSDGQMDVTFRISRRRLAKGPKLTILLPEVD